jgi:hypothetical protein
MTFEEIRATHDFEKRLMVWVCIKCKKTAIELHIHGDAKWRLTAQSCEGNNND